MKTKEYKDFSWRLHKEAGHKPIVAQMELTFRCPLHCTHCYTDCYNNAKSKKDELSTAQVKTILDKCRQAGVVWFCFTGGDPMVRRDFVTIYNYAKELGFIINVFSSLTSMSDEVFDAFKKNPPFNIETTLNAATPATYKKVTKTGLFQRHLKNIKRLNAGNIEVRVKTQITKQNIHEIDKIKSLVEGLGKDFRPSTMLFARLNRDTVPCSLRLSPKEAIRVNKEYGYYDEEVQPPGKKLKLKDMITEPTDKLFTCATGGHAFCISSQGRMFLCSCLRKPDYNLFDKKATVREGFDKLNRTVHSMKFKTESICRSCRYRMICKWCPARAALEKGFLEEPIEHFCRMTEEIIKERTLEHGIRDKV